AEKRTVFSSDSIFMIVHDPIARLADPILACRFASRPCSTGLLDPAERPLVRRTVSTGLQIHRQSCYSKQVVGPGHEIHPSLRSIHSSVASPAHSSNCLHPPEDFLHPFADSLAGLVAALPRRARIQSRHFNPLLARCVGRDRPFSAASHKFLLVIRFVGADGS